MTTERRTLIIINPASARARALWPKAESLLKHDSLSFELRETARAGDATHLTRAALRDGYNFIAVVGGDGTLSEAAAGFFELSEDAGGSHQHLPAQVNSGAALALLPAGTGDDFARGLAGRREPIEKWAAALSEYGRGAGKRRERVVDVIYGSAGPKAQSFICLNAATIGIGAEVAARVGAQGPFMCGLPGEARFLAAACGALARWRERRVRVIVDEGNAIECRTNLLAVANGKYAGGGMMFAPEARVDDGLIDLVVTADFKRGSIVRELTRIHKGGHVANPKVQIKQAARVRVETLDERDTLPVEADGNLRGTTPAEFRIMPRALKIVW